MSSNRRAWKVLGLLCTFGLLAGLIAGPASAKRLSAKQKTAIRAQLKKAVKHNPKAVTKKSFLRKASLVNFKLPVTIRLRGGDSASNPNAANIDLGASLGQRTINLGGLLPAEIQFADSYDGGALGNVKLQLLPGGGLSTTAIPLLWNPNVSDVPLGTTNAQGESGCLGFSGDSPLGTTPIYDPTGTSILGSPPLPAPLASGFPIIPGVDGLDKIAVSGAVGNANNIGTNPAPFPAGGPLAGAPDARDTVLRTAPLSLQISTPGIKTNSDVDGTQQVTMGASGGQANLFGNIPGKAYGIDVTLNLETRINSILRQVDSDQEKLIYGESWPARAFECRQAYTGWTQNYINGVRLKGNLKISPAIMPDGKLRIAKAKLESSDDGTQIGLAACLFPDRTFAEGANDSDGTAVTVPTPPIQPTVNRAGAPNKACNSQPTQLVKDAAVSPFTAPNGGFTTASDGSKVSVSGLLSVTNVDADILVGDAIP